MFCCSLNPTGYLNVLHVAHGQIRKGEPLEEYVEWLLERMPVTGIALEEEPGMWVPVPHDVYQIEFLVDGDAAALLDINLDALTSMLLTQPERQIVAARREHGRLLAAIRMTFWLLLPKQSVMP